MVSIFKNEGMSTAEWAAHYRWQGVLHFYLIDNNSTDNWRGKLKRVKLKARGLGSGDGGEEGETTCAGRALQLLTPSVTWKVPKMNKFMRRAIFTYGISAAAEAGLSGVELDNEHT